MAKNEIRIDDLYHKATFTTEELMEYDKKLSELSALLKECGMRFQLPREEIFRLHKLVEDMLFHRGIFLTKNL